MSTMTGELRRAHEAIKAGIAEMKQNNAYIPFEIHRACGILHHLVEGSVAEPKPYSLEDKIDILAQRMLGEAFCADWHDDPDKGVREVTRIKTFFVEQLTEFSEYKDAM
jgi:hypothetical protein